MYVWAYAVMRAAWFTVLIVAVAWVLQWSYTVHPVIPFVVLFSGLLVWQKKKIDYAKWMDSRVGLELAAHDVLRELVILKRIHDVMPPGVTDLDYLKRKPAAWAKAYDIVDNIDYMDSKNHESRLEDAR